MKTTLNKIRACGPCLEGWTELLRGLGKRQADDEPISIIQILDINGLTDALWCLRAVEGHDREMRLLAEVYGRRPPRHQFLADPRSIDVLNEIDGIVESRNNIWVIAKESAKRVANSVAWEYTENWDKAIDTVRAAQEKLLREVCAEIEALEATP